MDGVGEPDLIIPPGASPHAYSLRPSEAQALQEADLVFWIGPALTPWLGEAITTLAPDAHGLKLLETAGTTALEIREDALFEEDDHGHGETDGGSESHVEDADAADGDHAEDDGHAAEAAGHDDQDHGEETTEAGAQHDDQAEMTQADAHQDHAAGAHDPHAWLDPGNAKVWLDAIAAELSRADPENAGAYFANAAAGKADLDALIAEIDGMLDPVRNRNFIVFHDAYHYFETSFNFPASGAISLSDASRPSPARIEAIQGRVADANVTCVLGEPQFNPDLVRTVLDGTDATSGVLDPLGADLEPGAALYPQLLRNLAQTLADCL
jgi:zinc transport system substrate-binding protein